jgi:hypothetical protein
MDLSLSEKIKLDELSTANQKVEDLEIKLRLQVE